MKKTTFQVEYLKSDKTWVKLNDNLYDWEYALLVKEEVESRFSTTARIITVRFA